MFEKTQLRQAFAELRRDLMDEKGPRISTMRNYRFSILCYAPDEEFKLRGEVQRLTNDLVSAGWVVQSLSLQKLLLARVRAEGPEWMERMIAMEKRLDHDRALNHLRSKVSPLIEGDNDLGGIADECGRHIRAFAEAHPDKAERTVTLIGRTGALYPFFRSSALLKQLDGKTAGIPVVLLYPGLRKGRNTLSFMGQLQPDSDYRPRIYPEIVAT